MIRATNRLLSVNGSRRSFQLSSRIGVYYNNNKSNDQNRYKNININQNSYLPLIFLLASGIYCLFDSKSENCGIVGVVGTNDNSVEASGYLLEGLTILRNRGYDSAGIATVSPSRENPELAITKYASRDTTSDSIDLVRNNAVKHGGHFTGIAHTRWATHGGKTDENAHPHSDYLNRVAIIHNGTINNSYELKKELQSQGIKFSSETDTEVIAHLIGKYLDKGYETKEAVAKALSRCNGSWGLCVVNKMKPEEIVVACNGSPMVIGIGSGKTFIASETSAFSKYTKNYIAMKDGEIGVVTASNTTLDLSRVEIAPDHEVILSPDPYPHFTLKECLEQPEAIARSLSYGARMDGKRVILGGLDRNSDVMSQIHNMLLTACGTSRHAAEFGAKIMRDLDSFETVSVIDSAEVRRSDIPKRHGALLAVSQSGETKDVHRAVKIGEEAGVPCISVVNAVGSLIARTTGLGVYLNAGRENAVASTKAFTTQVTVLALIALWFRQTREDKEGLPELGLKKELLESLQRLPISFGMALGSRDKCKKVALELKDKNNLFVLGKGYGESIAHEGALKLKEMAYIHAEGYSGGALKHGPFALIEGEGGKDGSTPVIMVILDDDHAMHMRTAAEEVKARGAKVYIITDNPKLALNIDSDPIIIPNNGPLTALLAVLPLQ
eukprot:gene16466-22461_t